MSERVLLRAGPWSLVHEDGDLRDLTIDGTLLFGRIYVGVRAADWSTDPGTIRDLRIERGDDRFTVSYERAYGMAGIAFRSRVEVQGGPDGRITMAMHGTALAGFRSNRIGLCVLHHQGLAGSWVRVAHGAGGERETTFPVRIDPDNPFRDVAALTVRTGSGREVAAHLLGDAFETEDQRNWGDASFKTYSTMGGRPRPVALQAGEVLAQRLELSVSGAGMALAAELDGEADPAVLASLGITRLRAVIAPGQDLARLRRSPLPLDAVLHGPPETWPDLGSLRLASAVAVPGDRATTPAGWVGRLRSLLPGVPVGGGNASQFTELNRDRPGESGWGVLDIPVDPYAHGYDATSLLGNVPALAAITASAAALMPGAAVHLALAHGRHAGQRERHRGALGAQWRREAIAMAAASGVAVLCLGPASWLTADPSPA